MKKILRSDSFRRFLTGVLIGVGWILPGVSGGVIAVSLGIYSKMINAVGNFLRAKKQNFLYLLPIAVGACVGIFLISNVVEWLMSKWFNQVMFFFIGLVLGGIPALLREANTSTGFRKRYLFTFALGLSIVLLLFVTETTNITAEAQTKIEPWHAILAGAFISIGTIIPGISTSFVLIIFGIYEPLLSALNNLDIGVLFYAGLGFAGMSLLSIKSIQLLINRFPGYCLYCVLGFLIGSTCLAFPIPTLDFSLFTEVALFALGLLISLKMGKAPRQGDASSV
ncbi:MAG: DUF368 domain-containing protein [Eubacteriales bacterium]|jgi:putative membrane protein